VNRQKGTLFRSWVLIFSLHVFLSVSTSQCTKSNSFDHLAKEYQSIDESYHSRLSRVRSGQEHDELIRIRQKKLKKLLQKLENAPASDQSKIIQGKIHFDLDQTDQSLKIFNTLIRNNSRLSLEAKLGKVQIYLAQQKMQEALRIFKSIENKYLPDRHYYHVIYQLSLHSIKTEDRWLYSHKYLKAARSRSYLRLQAGHIYTNLAAIEKQRSDPEKAIKLLERALTQPLNRVAQRTIRCYLEPLKRINTRAPQIDIATWLHSQPVGISDLQGKISVIYFWSPGCHPCRQLFPKLQKLFLRHQGPEFLLLGIARLTGRYSDDQHHKISVSKSEEIKLIKNLLARHRASFPIGLTEETHILSDFGVMGFPTLFLIDQTVQIKDFILGVESFEKMAGEIHDLVSSIKASK
jgi:thioredoxin-like negative regulator of GroEL